MNFQFFIIHFRLKIKMGANNSTCGARGSGCKNGEKEVVSKIDWEKDSILNIVHGLSTSVAGSLTGKLNEYNDTLSGKFMDDVVYVEREHIDYINLLKARAEYDRMLDFAKAYVKVPYVERSTMLNEFFKSID